jgi:hypothetical protein
MNIKIKNLSIKKTKSIAWIFAMGVFSLLACSCKHDKINGGPENGYATGKVTDTRGNPLAGVEVAVENTLVGYHATANAVTDSKGNYKVKVSNVGTFHTSAYLTRAFNGKQYKLALHSDANDPFGNEGGVRNFQWKLSGQKPQVMEGFYGASIEIHNEPGYYIDQEDIVFTLTPIGNLIDGSPGSVLTLRSGEPQTSTYGYVADIPLGKYTLSANYNGIALKLKKLDSNQAYGNTTTVEFEQLISSGTPTAGISYYR